MRQELIEIIRKQNELMKGSLINKPVEAYVQKILNHATLITYTVKGNLAGFIAYYCNDLNKEDAFLTMLCVAPEFIGQGIGSYLLNCSITDIRSRGFKAYGLEVKKDNLSAINLYENEGFKMTETTVDTLLMSKQIDHEG